MEEKISFLIENVSKAENKLWVFLTTGVSFDTQLIQLSDKRHKEKKPVSLLLQVVYGAELAFIATQIIALIFLIGQGAMTQQNVFVIKQASYVLPSC